MQAPPAIRVFLCYAQEDELLRDRLEAHLKLLERSGAITTWHDGRLLPGQDWDGVVHAEIQRADIVLLLVSASFLDCDYTYEVEMARALERHVRGDALVIPIIVRPVDWEAAPFGKLSCLPGNGLAVTLWGDMDQAFLEVERGVRRAIEARTKGEAFTAEEPSDRPHAEERRLDAAVASSVVVGAPAEVLTMVTTADSGGLRALLRLEPQLFPVTPEEVRSSSFELEFPLDGQGRPRAAAVTVVLESGDFEPPRTRKKVLVPPAGDSTVCTFIVTPKRTGALWLQLEVQLDDVTIWSHRLRTSGEGSSPGANRGYLLTSMPLSTQARGAGQNAGRFAPAPPAAAPPPPPGFAFSPLPAPIGPPAYAPGYGPQVPSGLGGWAPALGFGQPPPVPPPPPLGFSKPLPPHGPGGRDPGPAFGPPPPLPVSAPPPPQPLGVGQAQPGAPLALNGPSPWASANPPRAPLIGTGAAELALALAPQVGPHERRALAGFLVSFHDDPFGKFWPLWQGRNLVGRAGSGENMDVPIAHDTVSTRHAAIDCDGERFSVADLGSRNGSFLGEEAIAGRGWLELRDGARLRFGNYAVLLIQVTARLWDEAILVVAGGP